LLRETAKVGPNKAQGGPIAGYTEPTAWRWCRTYRWIRNQWDPSEGWTSRIDR